MEANVIKITPMIIYKSQSVKPPLNAEVNVGMKAFNDFKPDSNKWSNSGPVSDFQENITYDPNGNILSYLRNGTTMAGNPLAMDSLYYQYLTGTNKLSFVMDSVPVGNYSVDIDNQPSANYKYDNIGNMIADTSEGLVIFWNTYHKVDSIYNWSDSTALKFIYDPMNNRVEKRYYSNVYPSSTPVDSITTYYIRDAQGNVISMYEKDPADTLKWSEVNLYGSSRLGQFRPDTAVYFPSYSLSGSPISNIMSGNKRFELTNHLGNVMTVIGDQKLPVDTNGGGTDFYSPMVLSAQDYYPGGMLIPGRGFSSESYRFGFNGKENDNDVKGNGNQQDYGMRIYDPRLVRFLSVDPLTKDFAFYTPYQFSGNKPIWKVDLDGLEEGDPPVQNGQTILEYPSKEELSKTFAKSFEQNIIQLVHDPNFTTDNNITFDYWGQDNLSKIILGRYVKEETQQDRKTYTGQALKVMTGLKDVELISEENERGIVPGSLQEFLYPFQVENTESVINPGVDIPKEIPISDGKSILYSVEIVIVEPN